jgi:hypothetical protein
VNAGGSQLWTVNGVLVTENHSGFQKIAPDGTGGVFITWAHFFTGNIYVQRLTQAGGAFFPNDGLLLTTAPAFYQEVINAGNGIGISAWVDFRNPGQPGIYAARFVAASPTPVRWIGFYGKQEGRNNRLTWITASEENNEAYIIQHSEDGVNFQDIGSVNGRGNSAVRSEYHFIHYLTPPGKNFYRVMQKDLDGSRSYSHIIFLEERINNFRIYPNPAGENLNINLEPGHGSLTILDASGRVVFTVAEPLPNNQFDISKLPRGYYTCRYNGKTIPFIKQ